MLLLSKLDAFPASLGKWDMYSLLWRGFALINMLCSGFNNKWSFYLFLGGLQINYFKNKLIILVHIIYLLIDMWLIIPNHNCFEYFKYLKLFGCKNVCYQLKWTNIWCLFQEKYSQSNSEGLLPISHLQLYLSLSLKQFQNQFSVLNTSLLNWSREGCILNIVPKIINSSQWNTFK